MKITIIVKLRRSYLEIYWYCQAKFLDCMVALVLMSGLEEICEIQKGLMMENGHLNEKKE